MRVRAGCTRRARRSVLRHRDDLAVVEARRPRPRAALRWLRSANASCASRVIAVASASFSALSPSETVHCSRHPRVDHPPAERGRVQRSSPAREARSGLSSTHGARLIDSTPPATHERRRRRPRPRGSPGSTASSARAAQPVDRRARHARRQAGEQHRHPGDVAVVLARAVGVAEEHVVDPRRGRAPGERSTQRARRRARRGRRGARRRARRRSGRTACGRRRGRRRRSSGGD